MSAMLISFVSLLSRRSRARCELLTAGAVALGVAPPDAGAGGAASAGVGIEKLLTCLEAVVKKAGTDGAATEEVELDSSVTWGSAGLQYAPTEGLFYATTDSGVYEVDISDGSATSVASLATNNISYIVDTCE